MSKFYNFKNPSDTCNIKKNIFKTSFKQIRKEGIYTKLIH